MATDDSIRILISKEEEMFVAQCLEHDIVVQAPDFETLKVRLAATLEAEGSLNGGLGGIPAAPTEFHEKWEQALALRDSPDNTEMRVAA